MYLILATIFRPLSPQMITDRTIHALEMHDTETLFQLTDPDEVKRLHLTPTAVSNFLQDTLWREPALQNVRLSHIDQTPPDQSAWEIHWDSEGSGTSAMIVTEIDSENLGWKLNLTNLLWGACWRHRHGVDGMREYVRLAHKYGITGIHQQGGNYVPLGVLENTVAASGN